MSGSGLNHNQNHSSHGKVLSRVLQPPGGASSLCLGGYGGGVSEPHNGRRGGGGGGGGSGYSGNSYRAPASYAPAEPQQQQYPPRERRDSLDDLVSCNIPGLQGHYQGRVSSKHDEPQAPMYQDNHPTSRGPVSGKDYASMLRAQIDMKASLSRDSENEAWTRSRQGSSSSQMHREQSIGGGSREDYRRRGNAAAEEYGSSSKQRGGGYGGGGSSQADYVSNGAHTSTRVGAPPGGKSTFSIGWN